MGFLAKASALFVGLRVTASYHEALQVEQSREQSLKAARHDIRTAIRIAASKIKFEDRFWQGQFASASYRVRPDITPRFMTQGSVAYDLLVDPCQSPPQQLDLDDGMYVNVDYLADGQPALVARALFALVEEALQPLCLRRGWKLDTSKDTCVRVQIDAGSHIDIPIYSAPRDLELDESVAFADAFSTKIIAKRAGQIYTRLPTDQIMLAQRDGTWQQSDPLKLQDWVEDCVRRYGQDFRRACRYFKGWRDYRWDRCCLTSITIMVAVQTALEDLKGAHRSMEDDCLIYEIAQRLPQIFKTDLMNPIYPGQQVILNVWTDEQRREVCEAAKCLASDMHAALRGTGDATLVVERLRSIFGSRIPYRPDMVVIAPTIAATVAAEKPAKVAAPAVVKSTSG